MRCYCCEDDFGLTAWYDAVLIDLIVARMHTSTVLTRSFEWDPSCRPFSIRKDTMAEMKLIGADPNDDALVPP